MKKFAPAVAKSKKAADHNVEKFRKEYRDEAIYLSSFMNLNSGYQAVSDTDLLSVSEDAKIDGIKNIITLNSLNHISSLNKFIAKVNEILPKGGLFICKFYPEEMQHKKHLLSHKFLKFKVGNIWKQICSKFRIVRDQFKKIKDEKNRPLPFAEALGRVAAGGFRMLDYKQFEEHVILVAQKKGEASFDVSASNSPIFKMKRIGQGGEVKDYYKFRTMHVYAEYLQNFVYKQNGLDNGNKFNNDFRITKWGFFLRKYWLDELPMIINLFKGDLKLVGVRPLSYQKFNLYSKEVQEYRTKFKPGLVPPFYADIPESLEGLMESEMRYLKSYEKEPLKTDIKYFFKALYNILIKGARSR